MGKKSIATKYVKELFKPLLVYYKAAGALSLVEHIGCDGVPSIRVRSILESMSEVEKQSTACHKKTRRIRNSIRIKITRRILKDLKTGRTNIDKIVEAKLKVLKDSYPYDPDKGITIIETPPAEEPYVPDLRPLGFSERDNKLLRYCWEKRLEELDSQDLSQIIVIMERILRLSNNRIIAMSAIKKSISESEESAESVESAESEELVEKEEIE